VLSRWFLFFTLVPAVEIVLLVWIASETSGLFVLGLVLGTGLLGVLLARHQGMQTLRRIAADLDSGRMPADSLVDGLLVMAAAVLLIIPGLLTDLAALVLLFPPSRKALKTFARRRLQERVVMAHYASFGSSHDRESIIDVKVIENPPRQLPR
jgi:UPF0716 protein FxsA